MTDWRLETPDGSPVRVVGIDTLELANPFVVYERKSNAYYMVGDGGCMWMGRDLREWNGPYKVTDIDSCAWYADASIVTAPEIHKFGGHYYYVASFTGVDNENVSRTSCEVLVSDKITGPYVSLNNDGCLLADGEIAGYPTFCVDELNAGYMIYGDSAMPEGELKIIRFTDDLKKRMGEAYVMLRGSEGMMHIGSPYLFITDKGMPGLLFTAHGENGTDVRVAYTANEMGHWLNGPWVVEKEPLMEGNFGGASLFTDYDGTMVMVLHKDTVIAGRSVKVPRFVKMDSQFEKLKKIGYYIF